MHVRPYVLGEENELWRLFYDTVRNVCQQDYTPEQLAAWAPERSLADWQPWRDRCATNQPLVCIVDDMVVGFASLVDTSLAALDEPQTGHLDQFFVHHAWQRRGVGRRLMSVVLSAAKSKAYQHLTADVSLTAWRFFGESGFEVVATQEVEVRGVVLQNFKMMHRLDA